MSGWEVGDLALCLYTGTIYHPCGGISSGKNCPPVNSIHRVSAIINPPWRSGSPSGYLALKFESGFSGDISRFKRIKPDTEGANEDDAAWLKGLLTKKVKA